MSFVKNASDLNVVTDAMQEYGYSRRPVIAKMELPEAILNMEEILQAADGLMVARGDLGVEMAAHEVPVAQKQLIMQANRVTCEPALSHIHTYTRTHSLSLSLAFM